MGKRRKDQDPPPEMRSVILRIPPEMLATLGAMADKRKISRNTMILTTLAKALRGKRTKETQG